MRTLIAPCWLGAAEKFSLGTGTGSHPSRDAYGDWPSGHCNVAPL